MAHGPGRIQGPTTDIGTAGFRRGAKLRFTDAGATVTQDAVDPTRTDVSFDLPIGSAFAILGAPVQTVSAGLEDMAGFTIALELFRAGRIWAMMSYSAQSVGGGVNAEAGHAIQIDGVDSDEAHRFLSGTNDMGVGAVQARSAVLVPGVYVIQGRHRRVGGAKTVETDLAQLMAMGPLAG